MAAEYTNEAPQQGPTSKKKKYIKKKKGLGFVFGRRSYDAYAVAQFLSMFAPLSRRPQTVSKRARRFAPFINAQSSANVQLCRRPGSRVAA